MPNLCRSHAPWYDKTYNPTIVLNIMMIIVASNTLMIFHWDFPINNSMGITILLSILCGVFITKRKSQSRKYMCALKTFVSIPDCIQAVDVAKSLVRRNNTELHMHSLTLTPNKLTSIFLDCERTLEYQKRVNLCLHEGEHPNSTHRTHPTQIWTYSLLD